MKIWVIIIVRASAIPLELGMIATARTGIAAGVAIESRDT